MSGVSRPVAASIGSPGDVQHPSAKTPKTTEAHAHPLPLKCSTLMRPSVKATKGMARICATLPMRGLIGFIVPLGSAGSGRLICRRLQDKRLAGLRQNSCAPLAGVIDPADVADARACVSEFDPCGEAAPPPSAVRAGEMARIGPAEVRARYDVDPKQVPDFIALRGDPSDKLPSAPGIGAVGAAALLRRYGTLEQALAAGRFAAQANQLRLFRSIATMNRKAPLPALRDQKPTWANAAALATKWRFTLPAKWLADTNAAARPPLRRPCPVDYPSPVLYESFRTLLTVSSNSNSVSRLRR
jgi:hypothetical protein